MRPDKAVQGPLPASKADGRTKDRPSPLDRQRAVYAIPMLSAPQKAVLLALAYRAGASWPRCWPSVRDLMDLASLSRRTCQRALRDLVAAGYVSVAHRRTPKGSSDSNVYRLELDAPRQPPDPEW